MALQEEVILHDDPPDLMQINPSHITELCLMREFAVVEEAAAVDEAAVEEPVTYEELLVV